MEALLDILRELHPETDFLKETRLVDETSQARTYSACSARTKRISALRYFDCAQQPLRSGTETKKNPMHCIGFFI